MGSDLRENSKDIFLTAPPFRRVKDLLSVRELEVEQIGRPYVNLNCLKDGKEYSGKYHCRGGSTAFAICADARETGMLQIT